MQITAQIAESLVRTHYGLSTEATIVNSYDDITCLLRGENGARYVLKISDCSRNAYFLDAQIQILRHLAQSPVAAQFQRHLLNTQGGEVTPLTDPSGKRYQMRLLSFVEGTLWAALPHRSPALHEALGGFLGRMDLALQDFSHPAMHRRYVWDISTAMDANAKLAHIRDHERRRIAAYYLLQFQTEVLPHLSALRHIYAHNDANDHNLLVRNGAIAGLIDFGDMVYTALINNVGVACTYAMLREDDPLSAAARVVAGYNAEIALTELELSLLYYIIAARLCISVTQSAWYASQEHANEHHFITENNAWTLLHQFIRINPIKAHHEFRRACGLREIEGMASSTILPGRIAHVGRNLSISYREKLTIVKGAFQYLYDDRGRTYVDCVNNPSHVGHCHPDVVRRMQTQIATLNTNSRYLHPAMVEYAKRLTATLPPSLRVCYFTNSGSEANDLAVRMARTFTGNKDIIVLDHAYHGTSTLAMEMSPYKFDGRGGFGRMPWIHKAVSPDLYRGPYRYGDSTAGEKYAADVQRIIDRLALEQKRPAVFICETLLGVGGQLPLPAGYLQAVYAHVRGAGGVCIADEVQVGFGRVGDAFWGFELQNVVPDIVVMGKPIGNGHPLAAVVVTDAIADAFNNGMEYFNTFGGNPVSMETGLAVMDVIQGESLQQHAKDVGNCLMAGLRTLMERHPMIGDVRGHGLFIGAELVRDRQTLVPAVPEIDEIVERVKARGYLLSTDGPHHNVLKIKPPMTFNRQNADELVAYLDEALSSVRIAQ